MRLERPSSRRSEKSAGFRGFGAWNSGTTAVSEVLLTSVEADAKRTGNELADRIILAYRERGWLPD
jgi:hypothetical protein